MIPKAVSSIGADDVEALVVGSRPEGRTLDYKLSLPGQTPENKVNLPLLSTPE